MTIVVDAAHGAAYNIAPHVFRELGAEVHAIGVHPDGFNINKGVGALHPELLAKEVKARGAQLGIALTAMPTACRWWMATAASTTATNCSTRSCASVCSAARWMAWSAR